MYAPKQHGFTKGRSWVVTSGEVIDKRWLRFSFPTFR